MKKLILLLLFIPLVSFGQSQLGKTKGYVLSECNKNENCEINKNENDVVFNIEISNNDEIINNYRAYRIYEFIIPIKSNNKIEYLYFNK